MGPPTISADQRHYLCWSWIDLDRFNGAADDLGGSTSLPSERVEYRSLLQWGRRRSRRINFWLAVKALTGYSKLQWGRRRSRRINRTYPHVHLSRESLQWGRRRSRRINPKSHKERRAAQCFNGAADDLGGSTRIEVRLEHLARPASMGPPTISADQRACAAPGVSWQARASMGPPTISADQQRRCASKISSSCGFNGAADDLGGSTSSRSGMALDEAVASMGPPTISADQRNWMRLFYARQMSFNGAADDLGGSTSPTPPVNAPRRAASMGPPTISADQLFGVFLPSHLLVFASMGPPTISADQLLFIWMNTYRNSCFNGAADDLGGSTFEACQ